MLDSDRIAQLDLIYKSKESK